MVEPEAEAPEAAGGEVDGPAPVATGGGEHDAPDATADATALEEVTVLKIDRDDIEDLVMHKPLLLQDIGKAIE